MLTRSRQAVGVQFSRQCRMASVLASEGLDLGVDLIAQSGGGVEAAHRGKGAGDAGVEAGVRGADESIRTRADSRPKASRGRSTRSTPTRTTASRRCWSRGRPTPSRSGRTRATSSRRSPTAGMANSPSSAGSCNGAPKGRPPPAIASRADVRRFTAPSQPTSAWRSSVGPHL